MAKTAAPQKTSKVKKIPKDTYESIPYRGVYQNGIIEDYDGNFSKMYPIPEINFDLEEDDKQEGHIIDYEKLLNAIDDGMTGQLTIINRNIDPDVIRNDILMKPQSDAYNDMRGEFNSYFSSILSEGHNNLIKEKYWTVATEADDIVDANDILKRADRRVNQVLRKITKADVKPCTINQRLGLMYDIFNSDQQLSFEKKTAGLTYTNKDGVVDLNLKTMAQNQIHSKNLISPDFIDYTGRTYFKLGENIYAKAGYIDPKLPNSISTSMLNDITDLSCNMIVSITYKQIPQQIASKMIKDKLNSINTQIGRQQIDAAQAGIVNPGATSTELENARVATTELVQEIAKRDQRIFKTTAICVVFGKTKEMVDTQFENLKSLVSSHLCHLRLIGGMQEHAFNMALPLAQDLVPMQMHRILTSESACAFWPFTVMDLNQSGGLVYGINPESQNMLRYNRKTGKNYNAIIMGESGSGKSYLVKEEITQKFLNTNEKIIIIDPQAEYVDLVRALGGTVIELSQSSKLHLNPLDMDVLYAGEDGNPIPEKCAEIEAMVAVMLGGEQYVGPLESNVIHRVATGLYKNYYKHMQVMAQKGITCDKQASPTLRDFYEDMAAMNDPTAQVLAKSIENYCIGSYSIFSEKTNVETEAQLVCYDVSKLNGPLKSLGMHVCLTDAKNTMITNGRRGKWTSLYLDEAHLFLKVQSAATILNTLYKTIRKFKGMPTVITQNINDFLKNDEAEALLENSAFIVIMNQQPGDRAILQSLYNISPALLQYITEQSVGHGLINTGTTIVPFENAFPQDTKCHDLFKSQKKDEDELVGSAV